MTFREVDNLIYAIMQEDEAAVKREERQVKLHYEVARLNGYWATVAGWRKHGSVKYATDLIKFHWEVDDTAPKLTKEQILEIQKKWDTREFKKVKHGT